MEERGKGQPRTFKTGEEFINAMMGYLQDCDDKDKFPNVAGFCVYMGINTDTFYAQKQYYSDAYKIVNQILEDSAINNKNISDTTRIFYMKNKCGYKDRQEIDASVSSDIEINILGVDEDEGNSN